MSTVVPLRFVAATAGYGQRRPDASFSAHAVPVGGTVAVRARSSGGWVWDLNLTGEGQCAEHVLEVTGGTCALVHGFSGDELQVDFTITHDGVGTEVVVTYNTRPD